MRIRYRGCGSWYELGYEVIYFGKTTRKGTSRCEPGGVV
jgi:hypothetical protein